jgi:hypothetical protein
VLKILADTRANRGQELAEFLADYLAARGITTVPPTAMLALPWHLDLNKPRRIIPDDPAMVFEVTDGEKILGCHVTWLSPDLTAKREQEPQRQSFGPVKGGYIPLYNELKSEKLVIAEGVETALSFGQMSGLPAIAGLSAKNLPAITPPCVREFIIAGDNDKNGTGFAGATALGLKLKRAGHIVRLAIPPRPDTVEKVDWNDILTKG